MPGEVRLAWTDPLDCAVNFTSSDPGVASLTKDLLAAWTIHGNAPGTAVITAHREGATVIAEELIVRVENCVDLVLMNRSLTVANGLTALVEPMGESQEETIGGEIRINANFDEGNTTATGEPLEDFHPDAVTGHGIDPSDPDLLAGTLEIRDLTDRGRWSVSFPGLVKVWADSPTGWVQVVPGALSDEVMLPQAIALRVEGLEGSGSMNDVAVVATFQPTGTEPTTVFEGCSDCALVTVVETRFMVTFDDGPFQLQTPATLDKLEQDDCFVDGAPAVAGFFEVGEDGSMARLFDPWADDYQGIDDNPDVTADVLARSHALGNHTANHDDFTGDSAAVVLGQIEAWEICFINALGYASDVSIFRPPYWAHTDAVYDGAAAAGYQIVWGTSGFGELWWPRPSWDVIADNTAAYLAAKWNTREQPQLKPKPAVICYHEMHDPIPDSIDAIIGRVRDRGFVFQHFSASRLYPRWEDYPPR